MGKILIADIETNAICASDTFVEESINTMHCFCAIDYLSEKEYRLRDAKEAVELINKYQVVVFHNGVKFDVPVLEKLSGLKVQAKVYDTKIAASTIFPMVQKYDWDNEIEGTTLNHSLKDWGIRLGEFKDDYTGGWDEWSKEMEDYCIQDCKVTLKLFEFLRDHESYSSDAVKLEHRVAKILSDIKVFGVKIDMDKLHQLDRLFKWEMEQVRNRLNVHFPQEVKKIYSKSGSPLPFLYGIRVEDEWVVDYTKKALLDTVKRTVDLTASQINSNIEVLGYRSYTKEFNPCARDQVIEYLEAEGWQPDKLSPKDGKAVVDDEVLSNLEYSQVPNILEYKRIIKLLGFTSRGNTAWQRLIVDGRLHGNINHMGTPHSRCSHTSPNLGQVPVRDPFYGPPIRSLFVADEGYKFLGFDASGLQLRCLAHWLAYFDKGEYARVLVETDIHSYNQEKAGLATRDQAKSFIYALLFGAAAEKISQIAGTDKAEASLLIDKFKKGIPALPALEYHLIRNKRQKGYIKTIDGRPVYVPRENLLLNYLLTSTEAVIMKSVLVTIKDLLEESGLVYGKDWYPSLFVHDEVQMNVQDDCIDVVTEVIKDSFGVVEKKLGLKCPLDCEVNIGRNWSETH